MEKHMRLEGAALIALSLMLVSVFALSVWMYDDLAASAEDGALAVFASDVRGFIDENEAVAAFLGLDDTVRTEDVAVDPAVVAAAADEYIARYNRIYESLE